MVKVPLDANMTKGLITGTEHFSTEVVSNATNTSVNTTVVQGTTYDPTMIFILVIIGIAILYIIFSGFDRERRY